MVDEIITHYEERLEVCDSVVTKCEIYMNAYEAIVQTQDEEIILLKRQLNIEERKNKKRVDWWVLLLLGAAGGFALGK